MNTAASSTLGANVSNWELVRRLFGLAWRYRRQCLGVLGLQLLLLAMGLSGLSLTGVGIDFIRHVVVPDVPLPKVPLGIPLPWGLPPLGVLSVIAGMILVLALLRSSLNYVYAVAAARLLQQQIVVYLRGLVYDKLQRLSFRFFDANSTGSIINRVTGDVQSVRLFVDGVIFQCVIMVLSLSIYLVYMVSLHPGLTLACLATTPLLATASLLFSRWVQPAYRRNRELADAMIRNLAESVQGIQVVKAFAREPEDRAKFIASNDAVTRQQRTIFWRVSIFSPSVGFLTQINLVILLGYGGWLVLNDQLPLGTGLVVFAGLLQQFSGQVNNVANVVNSIQQSLIGARRVFEILDAPVDVQNAPDAVRCPRLRGRVTFEGVHFAYRPNDTVLRDVSFDVQPGECVAILGQTGAGKSALMSLIPRFYDPDRGRVLLDGQDARRLDLADLRRNIGIVFQESFLFSNTVAANIAFGQPDASREQIERAARIAAAHDFIMELPQGYDTVLGESGTNLSGGQRQRLAIARAILLEPAILLLDDPTAAIDSRTEHEIFEALERAIAGRTTFIVAHRLSTLRRADRILVMEEGRIVQQGRHDDLIRQPGPYVRVAELQLADGGDVRYGPASRHGGAA
jgi:ABC-type multidrug transport system fused ATPase/permease subunit